MILLDTNVVSALMNDPPDEAAVRWIDRQSRTSIWITAVTVMEIEWGLKTMPVGNKRDRLAQIYQSFLKELSQRVAAFDREAAGFAADLIASRRKIGRVTDIRDTMIAGIVIAQHATLATRNVGHFCDISANVVNPWAC